MKGHALLRRLVMQAPPDLIATIYERERLREGATWPEIVRGAQELGIFTAEEAVLFLQLIGTRTWRPREQGEESSKAPSHSVLPETESSVGDEADQVQNVHRG